MKKSNKLKWRKISKGEYIGKYDETDICNIYNDFLDSFNDWRINLPYFSLGGYKTLKEAKIKAEEFLLVPENKNEKEIFLKRYELKERWKLI